MKVGKWDDGEVEILKELYSDPDLFAVDIAERLDRTVAAVRYKANAMGLKAPRERIIRSGYMGSDTEKSRLTRFKKGCEAPNKGKKMSPEQYARASRTMFKKGNIPATHREVGEERLSIDGYVEVKVAEPNVWKAKHRVIWEQHHGEIPPGYHIQFRNHDKTDFRIENLYMISKSEQFRTENCLMARYPEPVRQLIRLKGAITRQINKMEKNGQ